MKETINGVQVRRLASTRFGRTGLTGRAVDYFSFYHSVWRHLRGIVGPDDILVAKTDPPLLCLAVWPAARRRGAQLVNWSQDLYPEIAVELGVPLVRGPGASTMMQLRNLCFKSAAANVVVGELMRKKVIAFGIPPSNVHLIAIGATTTRSYPLPTSTIHCAGNGSWKTDLSSATPETSDAPMSSEPFFPPQQLRGQSRILFLMIGGGKGFEELSKEVVNRGLEDCVPLFSLPEPRTTEILTGRDGRSLAFTPPRS